jgi:SAM-dependent methyltransferase
MSSTPETYTHGHHESVLRSHRWRTVDNSAAYVIPYLRPDARVLDVGCGPGTITVEFAARVAPGVVLGVDRAADIIDDARRAADDAGSTNAQFMVGDVYDLDLPDASFDVVHAHQVLQHLGDPVGALREMRRVCTADGVIAVRDADYAAMTWYPRIPALDRWMELYQTITRHNHGEPDAGRRLLAWTLEAGCTAVVPSASVWCFATPDDRAWWGELWADRTVSSAFGAQIVESGLAEAPELDEIAEAWRAWSVAPDGWFAVLHGEVLATP